MQDNKYKKDVLFSIISLLIVLLASVILSFTFLPGIISYFSSLF